MFEVATGLDCDASDLDVVVPHQVGNNRLLIPKLLGFLNDKLDCQAHVLFVLNDCSENHVAVDAKTLHFSDHLAHTHYSIDYCL